MLNKIRSLKPDFQKLAKELQRRIVLRPRQLRYRQITDTTDLNAQNKIQDAVMKHTEQYGIFASFSLCPAFTSIDIGLQVNEAVTNTERPENSLIVVNRAPPDNAKGTVNNARNDFFCAELEGGVFVCGTCNGYEFSYIKPLIKNFYRLTNTNHLGSQFRSLQVLPKHAIDFTIPKERKRMIREGILERIEDFHGFIPDPPSVTHVLEVDNFGNVKLVLSKEDRELVEKAVAEKADIYVSFGKAALEVGVDSRSPEYKYSLYYKAAAAETLFAAPWGTNVLGGRSSSTLVGEPDANIETLTVPVMATILQRPGVMDPDFVADLPPTGAAVRLTTVRPPNCEIAHPSA